MSCANTLATAMAAIQRPLDDSFFKTSSGCGTAAICKSAPKKSVKHSHLVDLIMWLTNMKPYSVYTLGNKISTKGTVFNKESFIVMLFKFPKNIIVKVTANGGAIYDHFHELKIFSSNKTMVNSRLGAFSQNLKSFQKVNFLYPDKKNRKKLIQNFLDCIIDKKTKPLIKPREIIDVMSVCFAAENSLKLKKEVKIEYI